MAEHEQQRTHLRHRPSRHGRQRHRAPAAGRRLHQPADCARTPSSTCSTSARCIDFLAEQQPDYIFIAAAKVGGIQANNQYRADFLYQNLVIEANLIHGAHLAGVQRLMFLGSSCIYPRDCPQPIKEEYLLTGPLEATNEPYAIAKIAGVKLCESYKRQYGRQYVSVMPTNLYGPERQLRPGQQPCAAGADPQGARGQAARRRRVRGLGQRHAAPRVPVRRRPGRRLRVPDGTRLRRRRCVNIGTGEDVTIRELAETVMDVVGFDGRIVFDRSKPDGTPRKLLDVSRARRARLARPHGAARRHRARLREPRRSAPDRSQHDLIRKTP